MTLDELREKVARAIYEVDGSPINYRLAEETADAAIRIVVEACAGIMDQIAAEHVRRLTLSIYGGEAMLEEGGKRTARKGATAIRGIVK